MTKVSSGPSSVRQIGECGAGRSEGECEDEGEPGLCLSFFFFMPTVDGGAVCVWFFLGEGGGVCCEEKGEGDGEREASEASDDPSLVSLDFRFRLCRRCPVVSGISVGACLEPVTMICGRTGLVTPTTPDRPQLCAPAVPLGRGFSHASLSFVFLRR